MDMLSENVSWSANLEIIDKIIVRDEIGMPIFYEILFRVGAEE